jgi:hypothetical protein
MRVPVYVSECNLPAVTVAALDNLVAEPGSSLIASRQLAFLAEGWAGDTRLLERRIRPCDL